MLSESELNQLIQGIPLPTSDETIRAHHLAQTNLFVYRDINGGLGILLSNVGDSPEIPDFRKINAFFLDHTGWEIHVVPGLIPVEQFLTLLAEKKFCSSTWLRSKDKLDYLEEPDMFHDIFGHIPLLLNPVFSEFVHAFGKLGKKHIQHKEFILKIMLNKLSST